MSFRAMKMRHGDKNISYFFLSVYRAFEIVKDQDHCKITTTTTHPSAICLKFKYQFSGYDVTFQQNKEFKPRRHKDHKGNLA